MTSGRRRVRRMRRVPSVRRWGMLLISRIMSRGCWWRRRWGIPTVVGRIVVCVRVSRRVRGMRRRRVRRRRRVGRQRRVDRRPCLLLLMVRVRLVRLHLRGRRDGARVDGARGGLAHVRRDVPVVLPGPLRRAVVDAVPPHARPAVASGGPALGAVAPVAVLVPIAFPIAVAISLTLAVTFVVPPGVVVALGRVQPHGRARAAGEDGLAGCRRCVGHRTKRNRSRPHPDTDAARI